MKNKEIEGLLNDIKKQLTIDEKLGKEIAKDFHKTILNYEETKLLLSYREQLEKDNYDLDKENQMLFESNLKLQNNRDKVIEILGNYKHYSTPTEKQNRENEDIVDNAYNILKGGSDYE